MIATIASSCVGVVVVVIVRIVVAAVVVVVVMINLGCGDHRALWCRQNLASQYPCRSKVTIYHFNDNL